MADIISRGRPKPRVSRHTCRACDSVVDYTNDDEQEDYIETKYVVCPVCKEITYCGDMKWQYPTFDPHDGDQDPVWDPRK